MPGASKLVKTEEGQNPNHDDLMGDKLPDGESVVDEDLENPKEEVEEKEEVKTPEIEEVKGEVKEEEVVVDPLDEIRDDLAEVTSALRTERAKSKSLEDKWDVQQKALEEQGILEAADPEVAQKAVDAETAYSDKVSLLYEAMAVNPAYEDIDSVISEANQETLFKVFTQEIMQRDGVSAHDAEVAINSHIRNQANPVKWWYDNITNLTGETKVEDSTIKPKDAKETLKEVAGAPSIANMGGAGDVPKGPWTSAKIDDMGENLSGVPDDIMEKYLSGNLA